MGRHGIGDSGASRSAFTRALLADLAALERMIAEGRIESGVRRIGAEQEMFLIDGARAPAPLAGELLQEIDDPRFTTELARFNLEANLTPRLLAGPSLRALEAEIDECVAKVRTAMRARGGDVALVGILPTLTQADASLENMTPDPRYRALNDAVRMARGSDFRVRIKGLDELDTTHDNVMLESCNTSFQIHLQVSPDEFTRLYNIAQAVTAPALAVAANSPLLLRHRLWAETRIALFEHAVDSRSDAHRARSHPPRVHFGDRWVDDSVLDIFREDVARFRAMLMPTIESDPIATLDRGEIPKLQAVSAHNSTIYRWNRPCYGVADGIAHLRIENRTLPSGPTAADEVANAALFWGTVLDLATEERPIEQRMTFDDARCNFLSAARSGLDAQLVWLDGQGIGVGDLVRNDLLPRARRGLENAGVDAEDIDRYLGIMEQRVERRRTGTRWMIQSLGAMGDDIPIGARARSLTSTMVTNQETGRPVHEWELASMEEDPEGWRHAARTVRGIMSTDLFTVQPDDLVDLAASVMDWQRVRHIPVESEDGQLVGLISYWSLLRMVARGEAAEGEKGVLAASVMNKSPITVSKDTGTLEAMELMQEHHIGCLPVVEDGQLVGIVTEKDLIRVSRRLLEDYLRS